MSDAYVLLREPPGPNEKQRMASNPAVSAWVNASAGTGKTKVLVDRLLRLLLAGTPPARILCLTFTKAGAAEMANRVSARMAAWASMSSEALSQDLTDLTGDVPEPDMMDKARQLFAKTLDAPGGLQIVTIHSFCQSLLARFPLEANIPVHFTVLEERQATDLRAEAERSLLAESFANPESPLGAAVRRLLVMLSGNDFEALIKDIAANRLALHQHIQHGTGLTMAAVYQLLGITPAEATGKSLPTIDIDLVMVRHALDCLRVSKAVGDGNLYSALNVWLETQSVQPLLEILLTGEGNPRQNLPTKKIAEAAPDVLDFVKHLQEKAVALVEKQQALATARQTEDMLVLAEAFLSRYAALKTNIMALDYDDLIEQAHRLITKTDGTAWVLYKLDGGLDHILVDEAQDTNSRQWDILKTIAREFFSGIGARDTVLRTVFAVGDYKQSIYSVQGAEPDAFEEARLWFEEHIRASGGTFITVNLDTSFRSSAPVLQTVDKVFANPEVAAGVVRAEHAGQQHIVSAKNRGMAGHIEVWPLIPALPRAESGESWALPQPEALSLHPATQLARKIATQIRTWVKEGEVLQSHGRPVRYGDIMVLVQQRAKFVEPFIKACKAYGIPVSGMDRLIIGEQLAVEDVLALCQFLLLPNDDLALATALKGPLFGVSEEALLQLAHGRQGTLWGRLERIEGDVLFTPIRDYLSKLIAALDKLPPYALLARILGQPCPVDEVSGRRAFLRRLGPEAAEPLDELLALAISFEGRLTPSLQGFISWFQNSRTELKRELEHGGNVVRVMTVHGAKGLQAPIVFLPDTDRGTTLRKRLLLDKEGGPPLLASRSEDCDPVTTQRLEAIKEKNEEEKRRLLYVALTRAEERLYIGGWEKYRKAESEKPKKAKKEGPPRWYAAIQPAVASLGHAEEDGRIVLSAPQTAPLKTEKANATLHAAAGSTEVPLWLRLPAPPEPAPSRPLTPSRLDDAELAVQSPLAGDDGWRYRRGWLLHRLLQTLPDLPPAARERAGLKWLAGAEPSADAPALMAEVLAVLNNPALAPLFGPQSQAEVPVVGIVGSKVLAGQIDRLAVLDDAVWIVDYKTNRPPPQDVANAPLAYVQQLAAYRAALGKIYPNQTIRAALLWTDTLQLMEVPQNKLDSAMP